MLLNKVKLVIEIEDSNKVNEFLKDNWILLEIFQSEDKIKYILGYLG